MSGTEASLFATGIYGVVKVAACACFLTFVADSLGRRWSLIWTGFAQGLAMFVVGIYGRVNPPVEGEPVSPTALRCRGIEADMAVIDSAFWIRCYYVHLPLGKLKLRCLKMISRQCTVQKS